jgi:DNA-binding NtrC family response regulator
MRAGTEISISLTGGEVMFHVVDDVSQLCYILSKLIEIQGYKTMQFDSAESYLEYFNSAEFIPPIAILSDYVMSGKTGLEMIKKVRKKLPYQKAVIISGTSCSESDATIHSYLCYSLAKPYSIEELSSLLEALIKCEQDCNLNFGAHIRCEYGLDHECPFYHDKGTVTPPA